MTKSSVYTVVSDFAPISIFLYGELILAVQLGESAENSSDCLPFSVKQFRDYFRGTAKEFGGKLGVCGTPFQVAVWKGITEISYGEALTYGELAARIGSPGASRAVGTACGYNSCPIIIPCHRVVGKSNPLAFGSGPEWKQYLLSIESV
jgi:methylated-DNA-[protein]-cysteine S-methyltransferase